MTGPTQAWLVPRRWVQLPGSGHEVLLHGKHRSARGGSIEIWRTGDPRYPGGWDLSPVRGLCYVRCVR